MTWHLTSETLPDHDGPVSTWSPRSGPVDRMFFDRRGGEPRWCRGMDAVYPPKYWTPLPEPPEDES